MNDGKKINRIDSIFKDYVDNKFDYLRMIMKMSNEEIIKDLMDSGLKARGEKEIINQTRIKEIGIQASHRNQTTSLPTCPTPRSKQTITKQSRVLG